MKLRTTLPALLLACATLPLSAQAPVEEKGAGGLAGRVERIEQLLDSRGLVEMLSQLEALQAEVARLRGDVEVEMHALEDLRRRQRDLYTDIDTRLRRLEGGAPPAAEFGAGATAADSAGPPLETLSPVPVDDEAAPVAEAESALTVELLGATPAPTAAAAPVVEGVATAAAAAAGTAATVAGSDGAPAPEVAALPAAPVAEDDPVRARAEYQQAFELLKQSLYEQAIRAFQQFLVDHPGSEYADDAQYWLAEAFYVTRNFEAALPEYQKLAGNYPDSQKLTQALLKVGFTYQELGRVDEARAALRDLLNRYPGTSAARLAEERLATLPAPAAQ